MAEFINTIDVVGDDALTDSIIDRSITELRDDVLETIAAAFWGCTYLVCVDLPSVKSIQAYAFRNTGLARLILRGNTVCTLGGTNSIAYTPIAYGTGYIYVPAALKEQYAQSTNWSVYAAQFRALEDYTVDGTIWGDLDENKI